MWERRVTVERKMLKMVGARTHPCLTPIWGMLATNTHTSLHTHTHSMWLVPLQGQISSRPGITAERIGGLLMETCWALLTAHLNSASACVSDCFADSFVDVMGQ